MSDWDDLTPKEGPAEVSDAHKEADREVSTMYHDVFVKDLQGARLLKEWEDAYVWSPIVEENSTQFEAGINEGAARVVRLIKRRIESAENG